MGISSEENILFNHTTQELFSFRLGHGRRVQWIRLSHEIRSLRGDKSRFPAEFRRQFTGLGMEYFECRRNVRHRGGFRLSSGFCPFFMVIFQQAHAAGHAVFFDFIGLFFVHYQESTSLALNLFFSFGAILLVCISLWRMSRVTGQTMGTYAGVFGLLFLLALAGALLAVAFPLLMATFYDWGNRTLTYFSNSWLVIGLYICPSVIGLVLPMTLYLTHTKCVSSITC